MTSSDRARDLYQAHCQRLNPGDLKFAFPSYDLNLADLLPARDRPILDLGCGLGHLLAYLRARGFTQVTGIDVSATQIAACHEQGLTNAALVDDSVEYLGAHRASYDAIIALDVIEHVPKGATLDTLNAISQALRPGGIFIMRVPNIAAFVGAWARYRDFTHEISFDEDSARQVLEVSGFANVSVRAERTHYRNGLKGAAFEGTRHVLYFVLRAIYGLQAPGSVIPKIFTGNLYAVGRRASP